MRRLRAATAAATAAALLVVSAPRSPAAAGEPPAAPAAPCADWIAIAISVQGVAEVRRAQGATWLPTALGDRYCAGDTLSVRRRSRVAVVLRSEAVLRLDQDTTITFSGPREPRSFWLDLARGALHVVSRLRQGLGVSTGFVNALVEGTEFTVVAGDDATVVSVVEGTVAAENRLGRLRLASGESAIARAGQAPAPYLTIRPRDQVQWALYYPAVIDPAEPPAGEVARAAELLSVGRADEAADLLANVLARDPGDSQALALQSVIALARNETDRAVELALRAVASGPTSAAARTALSYAQQAKLDLRGARASAREAVRLGPDNALASARLAEMELAFGRVGDALEAAKRAARLRPDLGRAHTVLGFAHLADLDPAAALDAFEQAVRLDPADPLARLGLGLAKVRRGRLEEGRREIEAAVGLDPGNALVRSYLGKAYYEERRAGLAGEQFALAKQLDPNDPTPWLYDAIRKQSENRPVEALRDLQRSIELNDNRAVFRSRLLLDEDLAVREANLARIYDDLGFEQRALVEATRSIETDPANYSAHRFLADAYAARPRHGIARASERLQSQLLNPLASNPLLPSDALARPFIRSGTAPTDPAFSESDTLFNRDRISFIASGVAGGNETLGDEVAVAGRYGRVFLSVGQFHYETDGFRPNNDVKQDLYNLFAQARLSPSTSVQVELRDQERERGDLLLAFDPGNFLPDLRLKDDSRSARAGLRHVFAPGSDLLLSFIYRDGTFGTRVGAPVRIVEQEEGYLVEAQYLLRRRAVNVVVGAGRFDTDLKSDLTFPLLSDRTEVSILHTNAYVYSTIDLRDDVTATLGVSGDLAHGPPRDRDQLNPKIGLTWRAFPGTTIRAAAFRTLTRTLFDDRTLEPTQVAGFSQFYDETRATDAWRYGAGADQRLWRGAYAGAEVSRRDLDVPGTNVESGTPVPTLADWREVSARAYLYWAAARWLALAGEYEYERFDRDLPEAERILDLRTHRVPLTASVFAPFGLRTQFRATAVDQRGTFSDPIGNRTTGDDQFWVLDASIGYELPRRWGRISVEARNLLDESFRYQETDPFTPVSIPDRLIVARFTVAF